MPESDRQRIALMQPEQRSAHIPRMSHMLLQAQRVRARQLGSYYAKTDGYFTLESYYPHLLAKLEMLTFSWMLAGKHILTNKAMLQHYLEATKVQLAISQKVPFPVIDEEMRAAGYTDLEIYKRQMTQLLYFLETEVLMLLPEAPLPKKEGDGTDGEDLDEPDGEEPAFTSKTDSTEAENEGKSTK